ncbi:MAG: hypothetical protein ACRBK7_05480 [Acidimicrobiales bacterium]
MRPTIDEQLAGVDRLLDLVAADPRLGDESSLLLRDARRQLGRLRGSMPIRLRFIRWDNAATVALLTEVAPVLPSELQSTIGRFADASAGHASDTPEATEAELNDRLRTLLSEAIDVLPDSAAGEAARQRIITHLRTRVDAHPALNKTPIFPQEQS